ncbi:Creatinase/aminopeptidase [Pluteus cervinus]|uniref:Creatinase/aminopeptidase n=1 Tax=Pluteus cervinus TaxID=181527 RepID=A0ACD3BER2_9AGAR|nr:Creatinase/aminopeptidase [Pluteus cervinus]
MGGPLDDHQHLAPPPILQRYALLFLACIGCSFIVSCWSSASLSQVHEDGLVHPSLQHCADFPPISASEFSDRQTRLAESLHRLNASAYIAEPGATALYYANISTSHWHLSERPLLLVVTPSLIGDKIEPKITVITPKFEATRAKLLPIPAQVQFVEWPEEADPYRVAASVFPKGSNTVFVDSSIRHFLVHGLQQAIPQSQVATAPNEITQLRERKSPAELAILKCANEATLHALRDVHSQMYLGMRESEARAMMTSALLEAGLTNGGCLTLFGENAALPHGSGSDRVLGKADFALFDCTASLHGYWSDVTRTVALSQSEIPDDHLKIWYHVHDAQSIALETARRGILTRSVDEAARYSLRVAGYDSYFTHRLGHGIGLEVHEQPYLRGGSEDTIEIGHTFSDEPGVYIEGKVGVRLEDCFYVDDEGNAVYLTQAAGGQSQSPWLL